VVLTAVRAGQAVRDRRTQSAAPAQEPEPNGLGQSIGSTGSQWLILAAEMAGLVNDGWPSSPHSVPTAGEYSHSCQDIMVVVSELVTNALRYALPEPVATGPPGQIRLGLLEYGPWLLCAVADPGRATPVPRPCGSLAETGRGLQLICALSDLWGYTEPSDAGKIVWAMFTARHAARSRARLRPRPATPEPPVPA